MTKYTSDSSNFGADGPSSASSGRLGDLAEGED